MTHFRLDLLHPQTYSNLLYLSLGFPLGVGYWVVLIGGMLMGVVLAPTGIGVPLLVRNWLNIWNFAEFERALLRTLLALEVESPTAPAEKTGVALSRALMERAIFWRSLVYLLLKPLFGMLVSGAAVLVWLPGLVLLTSPIHRSPRFVDPGGPPIWFVCLVGLFILLVASRLTNMTTPAVARGVSWMLTDPRSDENTQQHRLEALTLASKAANLASSVNGKAQFEALLEQVLSSSTHAVGAEAGALLLETRKVLVGMNADELQGLLGQGAIEAPASQWRRTNFERGYVVTPKQSSSWRALAIIPLSGQKAYLLTRFDHSLPRRGELNFLRTVAEQVEVALENTRLISLAQNQAALEERHKLARELHDSVSQALYGITLGAKTAKAQLGRDPRKAEEALDYVLQLTEAGVSEMRALIFELRPESLEQGGLVAALQQQAEMMRLRYKLEVDTQLATEPDLPLEAKQSLLRIAQEALHNTLKHAKANRARLELHHGSLLIADDGIGFDTSQRFEGKLGQRTMRERAATMGASFALTSSNQGTQIRVEW